MRVRRFVAPTLKEAMARVRAELGRDAVILHTSHDRVGGFLGLFGRPQVEVMAGAADSSEIAPPPQVPSGASPGSNTPDLSPLQMELAEVRQLVLQMSRRVTVPSSLRDVPADFHSVFDNLVAHDVSFDLAEELCRVASWENASDAPIESHRTRELVAEVIVKQLGRPAPIDLSRGRRVVALVGPTGVGKTTTLAKLAAQYALIERKNVAFVTADTYRIAAVEQLKTYGDIIGVPVDVVLTPGEMKAAVKRHAHRDVVLIDSAGRSHLNAMHMSELKGFQDAAAPDETHLVVAATTNVRDARLIMDAFRPFGYDRLIISKVDEASTRGLALNLACESRLPLSYITTGQNVPDDIEIFDPAQLARSLVEEVSTWTTRHPDSDSLPTTSSRRSASALSLGLTDIRASSP